MTDEERNADEQARWDGLSDEEREFWKDVQTWIGQHVMNGINTLKAGYDPADPGKFYAVHFGVQLPMPDGSIWQIIVQPVIPVTEAEAAKPN